jgi:SAM-dependent methyltransferase
VISVPASSEAEFRSRVDGLFERLRVTARSGGSALGAELRRHETLLRQYLSAFRVSTPRSSLPVSDWSREELFVPYVGDALLRFVNTLELLVPSARRRLLELGAGPYLLSLLVRRIFDFEATYTNFFGNAADHSIGQDEQRLYNDATGEEWVWPYDSFNIELCDFPYPEGSFDVVLFCEVLEHLVLDPIPALRRIHKVLRPGGRLVLTTPNAVRLGNVAAMLAGSNFFDRYHPQNGPYGRHNREFTREELGLLAAQHGFVVETLVTRDRFDYRYSQLAKDNYERPGVMRWRPLTLRLRMLLAGASQRHRGDNIYLVARKV